MTIKLIRVSLIGFFILYAFEANAQTFIAPIISEKYSAAVYSRVYEITLSTLIPHEKQIQFAKFFTSKDSLILNAAKQEKTIKYIKGLVDSLDIAFDKIFDAETLFKYNYFKYKKFFDADANMESSYIQQKFNASDENTKVFYNLSIAKNQRVLKAILSNSSTIKLPDSTINFYHIYDSVFAKYLIAVQGEVFFNTQISKLNNLKPLAVKEKEEISKYYRIYCLTRGDDYHKNFNAAMQFSISDSNYYKLLYKDSINEIAKKQSQIELEHYVFKYNLNDDASNSIKSILDDKAQRNVWLDTRYYNRKKRDSLQTEINEISWNKVKKVLIKLGYTQLGKSKFIDALIYKQVLNISPIQVDSLVEANFELDMMIYNYDIATKGAILDNSFFTNYKLQDILREGQYDTLLQIEARPQAIASSKQHWDELIKYKLTDGLDSATVIKPIVSYHINRLILWERYKFDMKTYEKLSALNRQNKPDILKKLDAAKKEENVGDKEKTKVTW
jgi:hypothetical protein